MKIDKGDIDQLVVETSDAASIQGEVAWDGAPPEQAAQTQFAFGLQSVTNDARPGNSARSPIPGQFTFDALQSVAYTFRMWLTPTGSVPNAYLKDVKYGDLSVFHETLIAAPGASLRVTYGSNGGFVTATVTGKDGQAVAGAHVLAVDVGLSLVDDFRGYIRSAHCRTSVWVEFRLALILRFAVHDDGVRHRQNAR